MFFLVLIFFTQLTSSISS
uniref:Uncharacterized protein n=1 Tax=Arundo donax TaxID=35708 RepID=A0A0A9HJY4_ARUDO